ncbi:aminotransferase class IV [Leptolyngbya sp. FACHB-17]|uniref:aminotransferase class IV n=1 Tax=unclassified Leptolyngbya TaxID=2650499 RepID=UPI00167FFB2E|nr:aminotransferase class IV [Leptolyngbya sp. FACHB-17]MBD2079130.1 aminotransferase class IV [Leptolyngbya sp. FACHB-17]
MAGITQLQKPEYVYFGGKISRWEDANFHISSEAVLRGLNVFEGLKGYWQPDGRFGIVAMRRHYERLRRSAKILYIPFDMSYEEFEKAHHDLVKLLYQRDRNMWIRSTLYGDEGFWGEGSTSNLVLTAYHTPTKRPAPIDLGVTPWKRGTDLALPCRVKTSTNYQVARLVKIEGRDRGYSDMIILNQAGRVAETTQTCVLVVRDGKVFTPPTWEGALESITVDIIESLCKSMGIPFERRPIERTELLIADEVALAGTLAELTPVRSIETTQYGETPIINAISDRFFDAALGIDPHPAVDFSFVPAQRKTAFASIECTGAA